MNNKLSLLASLGVIAVAAYGAYLLSDVDKAEVAALNSTVKKLNDTLGTTVATKKDDTSMIVLRAGAAILVLAAIFVLLKKEK